MTFLIKKSSFLTAAMVFIGGLAFVSYASAAIGDGIIIYDELSPTTDVQGRTWTESTATMGVEQSPFAGTGVSKFISSKGAPTRQEILLGIQDLSGVLTIYRSINNGASWTTQWSATVGDGNLARFDIGYEQTGGDALVVYSSDAGGSNEILYQTWNGAGWSGAVNFDPVRTSGVVHGIKIAERPNSDEIGVVWADDNFDLSANIWTGSGWFGEPASALATNISKIGTSTVPTNRSYDLAFESLSGDLMVLWGIDATADPRFVIKAAGGAWGSVQIAASLVEEATVVDIASSPISDKIAYVNSTDVGNDCDAAVWSGSAWGTAVNDTSCRAPVVGDSGNNVDWLVDGSNEVAIFTYSDLAFGGIDWYQSTNGATPVAQSDITESPAVAGAERFAKAYISPNDGAQGIFIFEDGSSDIFVKKASLSGTVVTWTSVEPEGSAIETDASVSGFSPVAFAYARFELNVLSVNTTGSQAASLQSGIVNQHIGGGATSAFTLQVDSAATVSSVKVSDTGTVAMSNLTSPKLYYENGSSCSYDGTESNTDGTYSGEAVNFLLPSVAIGVSPNFTCLYFVFDIDGGETGAKGGQTIDVLIANPLTDVTVSGASNSDTGGKALAGTTVIEPNAVSTTYGSGLLDGARSSESIIVSGYGFGAPIGSERENCAGAVDSGCARFIDGGGATVAAADITAWSNSSIVFTINGSLASNGGDAALQIVAGGQSDADALTFYIYPRLSAIVTCSAGGARDSACGTSAAEEYADGDTFGVIFLSGDHFGSVQGAGSVQFTGDFGGITGTIHGTAEDACGTGGWNSSAICVEVPSSIADTVYSGNITLTRDTDAKTDTFTDFRILPRITPAVPSSAISGALIDVDGNHFCPSGTCPADPPSSDYIAYFGLEQAIASDFTAGCSLGSKWSHTEVCVKVPLGIASGTQKIKLQGQLLPMYESERADFTVLSTVPGDPDVSEPPVRQFKSDDVTPIAIGVSENDPSVFLKADLNSSLAIDMALQIEIQTAGVSFTCTGVNAIGTGGCAPYASGAGALEGTDIGGGACVNCTAFLQAKINFAGLSDGAKHWQARARNTVTEEYSPWVPFGENPESSSDFTVDTIAPSILFPPGDTCSDAYQDAGTNSVNIVWSLDETGDGQVEYGLNSDLSGSSLAPLTPNAPAVSHIIALSNLNSGAVYYFNVRSSDSAGNLAARPSSSPYCSFATSSVNQPGKTVLFHVMGESDAIASPITKYFTVLAPESGVSPKSAYIKVTGVVSSGTALTISANGVAAKNYSVSAANPTHYTFIYPITDPTAETNLNINDADPCTNGDVNPSPPPANLPPCNKLVITPEGGASISATSAEVVVTYGYDQ